jgi:hypothetical protein
MTKILAIRLKNIMPKLISENQGGFMQERKIVDKIVLVQEDIHSSKENKKKCIMIKLDMVNAFDPVRHSFLFEVISKFGFVDYCNFMRHSPGRSPLD